MSSALNGATTTAVPTRTTTLTKTLYYTIKS